MVYSNLCANLTSRLTLRKSLPSIQDHSMKFVVSLGLYYKSLLPNISEMVLP